MKKRLLAMLIAVFTLVTSVSVQLPIFVSAASSVENVVFFEDDFESGTLAENGWKMTGGATKVSAGGAYGNVLSISSKWERVGRTFTIPEGTAKYTFGFDVNLQAFDVESGWNSLNICLGNGLIDGVYTSDNVYYPIFRIGRYPNNGDVKISATKISTDGMLNDNSNNGVVLNTNEWVRADAVIDVENGTVDYYINGTYLDTNTNAEFIKEKLAASNISSVIFYPSNNGFGDGNAKAYFDNFSMSSVADEKDVKSYATVEDNYIEVEFDQTVKSPSDFSNVSLKALGGEKVTVSKTEKVLGNTIRITYDGSLKSGKEYEIDFGGLTSVSGNAFEKALFSVDAYVKDEEFSETFDGKTLDEVKNYKYKDLVTNNRPTLSENAEATVDAVENHGDVIKMTNPDSSSANLLYLLNVDSGTLKYYWPNGKTTFSFDFYADSSNTAEFSLAYTNVAENSGRKNLLRFTNAGRVVATDMNNTTLVEIGDFAKGTWHSVKVVTDYDTEKMTYFVDNYSPVTLTFAQILYETEYIDSTDSSIKSNAMRQLWIGGWISGKNSFMLDNLSLIHETEEMIVSTVRFTDSTGDDVAVDKLDEGITAIKIKFNREFTNEETLAQNFTLMNNAANVDFSGSLGEDKKTFIITPKDGGSFANSLGYTLKVSKSIGLSEDFEYRFTVGSVGVNEVSGYETSYNATLGQTLAQVLPATLTASYNGGTVTATAVWSSEKYNRFTPGTYTATAKLTFPDGCSYSGSPITTSVVVANGTEETITLQNVEVLKNVSERSPIATGGLSKTDSLQMGILTGEMTVSMSDEFETKEYICGGKIGSTNIAIADSDGGEKVNAYAKTNTDGEITINFNEAQTLEDIKLVFTNVSEYPKADLEWAKTTDDFTGWDLELLLNDGTNWKKFYADKTDFKTYVDANASVGSYGTSIEKHDAIFPTLKLSNLNELSGVKALKIRLKAQDGKNYKLIEADVNVANESSSIVSKRQEVQTPVSFSKIFSTGAVIQRDEVFNVTGFGGTTNGTVEAKLIKTSDDSTLQTKTGTSDGNKWSVAFDAVEGSKNTYKIVVTDKTSGTSAEIKDVLFGDVYVASGQSNMALAVSKMIQKMAKETGETENAVKERLGIGNGDGNVRFFTQQGYRSSIMPLDEAYTGVWVTDNNTYNYANNGSSIVNVSAVAYYYAQKLYTELNIPVAVYTVPRNGSDIRAWMPEASYKTIYSKDLTDCERSNYLDNQVRTGSYNALVAPLTSQKIKGVIWYQGEGNAAAPDEYSKLFTAMVKGWRDAFNNSELNFNFVQLGGWDLGTNYPTFRNMQMKLWLTMGDNIDMATAIDLGMTGGITQAEKNEDIHYANKQPVGERLALNALASIYGKQVENNGPLVNKVEKNNGTIVVYFDNAEGLKAVSREDLYGDFNEIEDSVVKGFEISKNGTDWTPVDGTIIASNNTVEIEADDCKYIRYAWLSNAVGMDDNEDYVQKINLYNGSNLPAYPFVAALEADSTIGTVLNSDGTAKIEIDFNSSKLKTDGKLIIAYYAEDGTLQTADIEDISLMLKESYTKTVSAKGADAVKAMIFDNMTNIKPLARQK